MSFFFDVWSCEGFVLASDVRLIIDEEPHHMHKIAMSSPNSGVRCAVAVCGEYPQNCLNFFTEAVAVGDTLRDVAQRFATKWVRRYAGTGCYSAVHLVGYEEVPDSGTLVPQMWYWTSASGENSRSKEELARELSSFSKPIPDNNHIPHKIRELTGRLPGPGLQQEHSLVVAFLRLNEPLFTWNGDTRFWRTAADAVGSAMNLLRREKSTWTIEEVSSVTALCLEFLIRLGNLIPESTVGLSPRDEFDMLSVTPGGTEWILRAELDG